MAPILYRYTNFSPSSAYSCATYRADLSIKYGICQSLHNDPDPRTLNLASVFVGSMSLGDIVSAFFLGLCLVAMLCVIKWSMDYRLRRRRWSWGLDPDDAIRESDRGRVFGAGGMGNGRKLDKIELGWRRVRTVMRS